MVLEEVNGFRVIKGGFQELEDVLVVLKEILGDLDTSKDS